MREFFFVIRVIVLTLVVVVLLQINYKGQTFETRATQIFGSSQTIESIRKSTNEFVHFIKNKISNTQSSDK